MSIDSRDLLEVAVGDKKPEELKLRKTDTFLDYLPKDVLQYLYQYTGPLDCYYMTNIVYDNQGNRYPNFYVWVNKTHNEAIQDARNKGFWNNRVASAQIMFMEGRPYLVQPVEKRRLYGMPKSPKAKKANDGSATMRCTGKTISGKRCKHRTSNNNGKCSIHSNK
jgi:hypothetical protein